MDFSADDEQALKQYLPSEFGKKDGSVNVEAQIERARRPVVDESKQAKKEAKLREKESARENQKLASETSLPSAQKPGDEPPPE